MNKSKIYLSLLTLILITGLFHSCKKEHSHEEVTPESVSISIDGPTNAIEYEHGDTVFIKSRISSLSEMHGYEVHLIRESDNTELFTAEKHAHGTSYDISEFWVNNCMTHTAIELEISAITDHDGNKVSKKVQIHCHGH